jgi:hypothetical protein
MRLPVVVGCALYASTIASPTGALSQLTAPAEVVERAQEHIASRVGKAYAAENFELQPELCGVTFRHDRFAIDTECGSATPDDGRTIESYTVSYKYRPWVVIDAPNPSVHVRVPIDLALPANGYVGTFDRAGQIVEPKVTRAEAETKMRAAEKVAPLQTPIRLLVPGSHKHANPVWQGSFTIAEPTPMSWVTRGVTVDAVTGDVVIEADVTGVACN